MTNYIGKKCVFRGDKSGAFFGTLLEKEGQEVKIGNCRRLWFWAGACSLTDLAVIGTNDMDQCLFTIPIEEMVITDCVEILPCTDLAIKILEGVKPWTKK